MIDFEIEDPLEKITVDEAIEALRKLQRTSRGLSHYDCLNKAIKALQATRWIPVTERLPEICERDVNGNITFSEKVWSCIDCGDGFYWQQTDQYTTNCGGGWMSEVPEDGFTPKVVAWMPLPEPYEVK